MPAVKIDEEKSLGASVVDLRDVQRSANRTSEAILLVCWVLGWLAYEGVRGGIKSRVANPIVDRSMGMIDVETAATRNRHRASLAATAESALAATSSEASALLARVIHTLLKFIPAHGVHRSGGVPGNRDGLGSAIGIDPRHRHARGHNLADGIASCILISSILQCRKRLKSALSAA